MRLAELRARQMCFWICAYLRRNVPPARLRRVAAMGQRAASSCRQSGTRGGGPGGPALIASPPRRPLSTQREDNQFEGAGKVAHDQGPR